jgi:hypothetical protein
MSLRRKLIKTFEFDETKRSLITLGANVRLDPADGRVKLVLGATGYSTAANLFFKTWLTTPKAARAWYGFEALVATPTNTSVRYRLSTDGVSQKFWNGSIWTDATTSDWNTEVQVSANIATFPITQRAIQVIANLTTTNASSTPEVTSFKIGYEADIDFDEDLIARSLLPALRALRPVGEHTVKIAAAASTIDLSKIETPYNVINVVAAYNSTTDPTSETNLFQSYNAVTKILTLSSSVAAGHRVQIVFQYEPEVALSTSQDYKEFSKIPCIIIESIRESSRYESGNDSIIANRTTGAAWTLEGGQQRCVELDVSWIADKGLDMSRLSTVIESFFRDGTLRSVGMDESYSLQLLSSHLYIPGARQNDVHESRLTARIRDALFYTSDAKQAFAATSFILQGGNVNLTVE